VCLDCDPAISLHITVCFTTLLACAPCYSVVHFIHWVHVTDHNVNYDCRTTNFSTLITLNLLESLRRQISINVLQILWSVFPIIVMFPFVSFVPAAAESSPAHQCILCGGYLRSRVQLSSPHLSALHKHMRVDRRRERFQCQQVR
jgi:hypothetical protein